MTVPITHGSGKDTWRGNIQNSGVSRLLEWNTVWVPIYKPLQAPLVSKALNGLGPQRLSPSLASFLVLRYAEGLITLGSSATLRAAGNVVLGDSFLCGV